MIDYNEKMTLDVVIRLKKEKLEKIHESQKRIGEISKGILSPKKNISPVDSILNHISTGFAIFDGVKIGLDVAKRIKERIGKKKNKEQ